MQDLAWSPDGTGVAFASNLAGDAADDNDLYVVDAEGENFATLVRGPGDDETPAWRPTRGNTPPIAAPPPPESGGAVTSGADLEALSDPDRTMQILSAIESGSGKRVRRASCDVTARTQRCAVTFADSSCEIWSAQTEDGSLSVSRVARACG